MKYSIVIPCTLLKLMDKTYWKQCLFQPIFEIYQNIALFQLDGPNAGNFVHEDEEEDEPDFYAHGMGG